MRKKREKRIMIPESLGNRLCSLWPYILIFVIDAGLHITIFFMYGFSVKFLFRVICSYIFFIYPLFLAVDALWSFQPCVCRILSGETLINRKYYMNTARKEISEEDLASVTINIPVYLEENDVIFQTIKTSIDAMKRYRDFSGLPVNIIVSDDGIAPLLGIENLKDEVELLIDFWNTDPSILGISQKKAIERIVFYRNNNIAFVARPAAGRTGLFKKASNLNHTFRLSRSISSGLTSEAGTIDSNGYWEGNIDIYDIILLLDKDSSMKAGVIEAIAPEFSYDEKLAYVQCATSAANLNENYFSHMSGYHLNNLFHNIWPCKALQGFFVPLVGHNVFLRREYLEKSGLWAENRVSEDYDKALRFYQMGYHGKYAQIHGLEFTECASRTFLEETQKQYRYSYGLCELIFDSSVFVKKTRRCDILFMMLYFCSVINLSLSVPVILIECYIGEFYLMWAGFLLTALAFISLPFARKVIMKHRTESDRLGNLRDWLVLVISFVGYSLSVFASSFRYFRNKIIQNKKALPSTNVDELIYSFKEGIGQIYQYIRKHPVFLIVAPMCVDRVFFLLTQRGLRLIISWTYAFLVFCPVLAPFLLTPSLFSGLLRRLHSMLIGSVKNL